MKAKKKSYHVPDQNQQGADGVADRKDSGSAVVAPTKPAKVPKIKTGPLTETKVRKVSPDDIDDCPFPLRVPSVDAVDSMVRSIIEAGGIQAPLTVRETPGDRYQLLAGACRLAAARRLGLATVRVVVVDADDGQARVLGLMENLHRSDLTPMQRAEGILAFQAALGGVSDAEVARRLGLSTARMSQLMTLATLPDSVRALVSEGRLKEVQVRALKTATGGDSELLVATAPLVADGKAAPETIASIVDAVRTSVHNVNDDGKSRPLTSPSERVAARLRGTVKFLKRTSEEPAEDLNREQLAKRIEDHVGECRALAEKLRTALDSSSRHDDGAALNSEQG